MNLRLLRVAAHVELVSLIVMLVNLATVHLDVVSSMMGPLHGCTYLVIVAAFWRSPEATAITKAVALIPGIGGQLAVHRQQPDAVATQLPVREEWSGTTG